MRKPDCKYCLHSGDWCNYMYPCSLLGFSVVANRVNKIINKNEVCRSEELGKGSFKLDRKKL